MRPFLPAEIQQIRRIVEAIVPMHCSVQANSINQGWQVNLVICGRVSCHAYDLRPPINRGALVAIAEAWESGNYEPPITGHRPQHNLRLASEGDVIAWVKTAKAGERAVYFEGRLAHFRNTANVTLRKLHAQSDNKTGKTKHWARKANQMEGLAQQLLLLQIIGKLCSSDVVYLVQQRKPDGSGAVYYAVRK